ncbi:MAG: hypothetical protein AAFV98_12130 [Chloroflexota bacterium]
MKILYLEDDKMLSEIFQTAVMSYDPEMDIEHFVNGEKALDYIKANLDDIAAIVLDIRVTGALTGLEVAQATRELGYSGPMFISSAYRKPEKSFLEKYGCEWMAKPWQIMDVALRIVPLVRVQRQLSTTHNT